MKFAAESRWLAAAAKLALRGHGGAEPNPMVGCILVGADGAMVSWGYHARCGQAHAEAMAIARAGSRSKDCTAFVTLEPCAHHGRTPPCAEALIRAGVTRVVYAVSDPNPEASGGATALRNSGIAVDRVPCDACEAVSMPFVHRVRESRPWVIAKWAQTLDGRTATRSGDSKWISGPRSRAMVHRERARVDAIMVGIGTVFADDPHLLPRRMTCRRIPRRVIIDPSLATPIDAQVVRTAPQGPVEIACSVEAIASLTTHARDGWERAGIRLTPLAPPRVDAVHGSMRGLVGGTLAHLMRDLGARGVSTILVEGGAGLLGALFDEDLVDDAWCFVAPLAAADAAGVPVATGLGRILMGDSLRFRLVDTRRRGLDAMLWWRRQRGSGTGGASGARAPARSS